MSIFLTSGMIASQINEVVGGTSTVDQGSMVVTPSSRLGRRSVELSKLARDGCLVLPERTCHPRWCEKGRKSGGEGGLAIRR